MGYKNGWVFPWPVPLLGTPNPRYLLVLSPFCNSEGKCYPGLTGWREYHEGSGSGHSQEYVDADNPETGAITPQAGESTTILEQTWHLLYHPDV